MFPTALIFWPHGMRGREPALAQLVGDADLAEGRLLDCKRNDGVFDLLRHTVFEHRLFTTDLLQRASDRTAPAANASWIAGR